MGSSQSTDVYSDAAEFGKVYTTISLVIASVLCIIMIIIGIVVLNINDPHTDMVNAIITNSMCNDSYDPTTNRNIRNCNLYLSYNYKGKNYGNINYTINNTTTMYFTGQNFTIYINPNDPNDISNLSKTQEKYMGFALIGMGIFILLIAIFHWWLTRKSKFFAAAEGTGAGISIFRHTLL
jgi:ATP-dependent Zn protease